MMRFMDNLSTCSLANSKSQFADSGDKSSTSTSSSSYIFIMQLAKRDTLQRIQVHTMNVVTYAKLMIVTTHREQDI